MNLMFLCFFWLLVSIKLVCSTNQFSEPPPKCVEELDCGLNGLCNTTSGLCICDAPWIGPECSSLELLPVHPNTGYQNVTSDGKPISSWGGSVVGDDKGGYLMFVSELLSHCGISSWTYNSRVMMAYSNSAIGPYKAVKEIFPAFAHEPTAARGPDGEYVVWFTRYHYVNLSSPCLDECTDGSTSSACIDHRPPAGTYMQTYMSWATDPFGDWAEPVMVYNGTAGSLDGSSFTSDTNMAPVIYSNGSLIGLWRGAGPDPTAQEDIISGIFVVRATNWKDPKTYDWGLISMKNSIMKIDNPPYGAVYDDEEDPHVYLDSKGRLHAVVHCFGFGAHLASADGGYNWRYYGPVYKGNDISDPKLWQKSLWPETVPLVGGGAIGVNRRERPHMVFDESGQLVAYSAGVTLQVGPGDYSWTMFQPTVLFSL